MGASAEYRTNTTMERKRSTLHNTGFTDLSLTHKRVECPMSKNRKHSITTLFYLCIQEIYIKKLTLPHIRKKEYNFTGTMIQPYSKGSQLPRCPSTRLKLELLKVQCTTSQNTPKPKENFTCCHTRHLGRTVSREPIAT
jgi:hypothetical protein